MSSNIRVLSLYFLPCICCSFRVSLIAALRNLPNITWCHVCSGRPIASLAFHIEGDALAVASGHKLYMWQYTRQQQGEEGAPAVALKTRRSLRAVHFHPLGLPLVLTAEVNDVSAPVTLPHGHPPPPPSQASAPLPRSAGYQGPVHADLLRQPSVEAAGISQDHTSSNAQDDDDWPVQRPPHRRLSEVFRALMQEEREEELLAQLESSASQQASQMHSSASRQILGMTGYSHGHSIRQHDPVPTQSQSLSHRSSAGFGSLPHPPVPIRQLRPQSRPRSFHPLRHSIAGDPLVSVMSACIPVSCCLDALKCICPALTCICSVVNTLLQCIV
jgi:hypothetical protein